MKYLLIILPCLFLGCAQYAADIQAASDEELFTELATVAVLLPGGRHAEVKEEFRRRHPDWNWAVINQGRIFKGMSKEEVRLSWGPPHRINQSSYGEQWVYHRGSKEKPTDYLHFENNILTDTE